MNKIGLGILAINVLGVKFPEKFQMFNTVVKNKSDVKEYKR